MYEQEKWELRHGVGARLGLSTEAVGLAFFPTFARRTVTVTRARIRAIRAHLSRELEKIQVGKPAPGTSDDTTGPLQRLSVGPICAKCRGHCCRNGGDHGYITSDTLTRSASLLSSSADVVQHYLSFVPKRAYAHSCIFHTAKGCALPRDLRSETCTRYFCTSLTQLGATLAKSPGAAYIAVFEPVPGRRRIQVVRDSTAPDSQQRD